MWKAMEVEVEQHLQMTVRIISVVLWSGSRCDNGIWSG